LGRQGGIARYRGVPFDVESTLVVIVDVGEAGMLNPLVRVVAVRVVLDGDEDFGWMSSWEVVV